MTDPLRPAPPSAIEPLLLLRQARVLSGGSPPLVGLWSDAERALFRRMLPPPTETGLRKAAAAAYYALFHALTVQAARTLSATRSPYEEYRLARRFAHRDLRLVADWTLGALEPPPDWASRVGSLRADQQVQAMARAIHTLWSARTEADYDHFASFSVPRVLRLIDTAFEATNTAASPVFATGRVGRTFYELLASRVRA